MTLQEQIAAKLRANEPLEARIADGSITEDELSQMEANNAEVRRLQGLAQKAAEAAELRASHVQTVTSAATEPLPISGGAPVTRKDDVPVYASVRSNAVTSFKGNADERAKKAYGFGLFLRGALRGDAQAAKQLRGLWDIELRAHIEGQNASGGYLVPEVFENDLIDLREQYGVIRRVAKTRTMTSDTLSVPRRTGGLTAYFVGENAAITESTKGWDRVSLTAKKIGVLAKYSSELSEDAVIELGNDLASEISYAFAQKEDDCGFNGDGTSTYGGITGICPALKGLSGTIANIAGLVVASGNAYSEIVLGDFNKVKAKLPVYANNGNARWFMSHVFYHEVAEKLMLAAGGVTAAEIAAGRNTPVFMGYPVELVQVMPKAEANSQVCALFGDPSLGVQFGSRRGTTIAMSEHLNFAEDELAIRGTERFDIVVHDVGNASGTAADRVPGPVVGLITAAS